MNGPRIQAGYKTEQYLIQMSKREMQKNMKELTQYKTNRHHNSNDQLL